MSSLACFQQIPSQITTIRHNLVELPIISPKNPIPTKFMWEEVYPNLKFEVPQRRGVLHDSENGFLLQFGVEMVSKVWGFDGQQWWRRKGEEKQRGRWEGELLNFLLSEERECGFYFKRIFSFLFPKSYATCLLLSGAKRGPLFLLMWLILSHKERKIWTFEC